MIGGRSGWVAWPVGALCLGVLAGLVWLAAPGVPGAVQFVGDTLRSGTDASARPTATDRPLDRVGTAEDDDCRSLYPGALWRELTWGSDAVLDQTRTRPEISATSVRDALEPAVRMTCVWREGEGARIRTTLSDVDAAAAALAGPALASAGFDCAAFGDGVRCTRRADGVTEDEVIADGLWLSTWVEGEHPSRYAQRLAAHLWG